MILLSNGGGGGGGVESCRPILTIVRDFVVEGVVSLQFLKKGQRYLYKCKKLTGNQQKLSTADRTIP